MSSHKNLPEVRSRSQLTQECSQPTDGFSAKEYPNWLAKLFQIFLAAYRNLWSDAFTCPQFGKETHEATKFLWFQALKGYTDEMIIECGLEAVKNHKYPPSVPEFLEIINARFRRWRDNLDAHKRAEEERLRLLPPPEPENAPKATTEEEKRHHRLTMAELDKMRAMVDLPPFDEEAFKAGRLKLNATAHHYLNVMRMATGLKPKTWPEDDQGTTQ